MKISPISEILNENNNPKTVLASSNVGQIISVYVKKYLKLILIWFQTKDKKPSKAWNWNLKINLNSDTVQFKSKLNLTPRIENWILPVVYCVNCVHITYITGCVLWLCTKLLREYIVPSLSFRPAFNKYKLKLNVYLKFVQNELSRFFIGYGDLKASARVLIP